MSKKKPARKKSLTRQPFFPPSVSVGARNIAASAVDPVAFWDELEIQDGEPIHTLARACQRAYPNSSDHPDDQESHNMLMGARAGFLIGLELGKRLGGAR